MIPVSELPVLTDIDQFVNMEPPRNFAKISMGLERYYHRMALVYLAREREVKRRKQATIDDARQEVIAMNMQGTATPPKYEDLDPLSQRLVDSLTGTKVERVDKPWQKR